MPKKYQHQIKLIKVSEIRLNKYNPNVMDVELKDQLKRRIAQEGMLQPILLRKIKPEKEVKYEVVDGEHRFLATKENEYEEILALVLDKSLPEAMISTINMNKIKGEFDTLKLAGVIHELHKTYSMEELEEKLGYSPEQMEGMEKLLTYDFDSLSNEGIDGLDKTAPEEYEFKIMLTAKQNDIINKAIEATGKEGIPDALVKISLEYLAKHGTKSNKGRT